MGQELLIQNGNKIYFPVVEDEIVWTTERKGAAGKLEIKLFKDETINFEEGNAVSFKVNNDKVFYGFVFKKKSDKEEIVKTTAYDQLRYLKNKDTRAYTKRRADQVIESIAKDYQLKVGTLQNTEYIIAKKAETNQTLFDIILNALDATLQNRNKMYVLYDDFGELTLKNIENMKVNIVIDEETGQNYDYESSIDSDTYNQIKLTYDNSETGKREVYIAKDTKNINKWGILQYFDTIDEETNGKVKAKALLELYNNKTKKLEIKGALGDIRVRGGSLVIVNLDLEDAKLQNYMLVEKAKHTFKNGEHFMDLTLRGQNFISS